MPNVTLQDILQYYHDEGYTDTEIAAIADVSQSTINRIRNGLISGNSLIEDLHRLIEDYQTETNNAFIHAPHENLGIPVPHETNEDTLQTPMQQSLTLFSQVLNTLFDASLYLVFIGVVLTFILVYNGNKALFYPSYQTKHTHA